MTEMIKLTKTLSELLKDAQYPQNLQKNRKKEYSKNQNTKYLKYKFYWVGLRADNIEELNIKTI